MGTVLLVLLILALFGLLPGFGLHAYGPWPSGLIGLLVIILLVALFTGRL